MTRAISITITIGCVAFLSLFAACKSTSPQTPSMPPPPPPPVATTASARPAPPVRPTVTAVHIDDNILGACGIRADKAFFAFDSAQLESIDLGPLGQIADCFERGPLKGRSMRLIGRADPRGESEYNMVLGQSRADRVRSFLLNKGLDGNRVGTTSRGAMDATGRDETSWANDRRVDMVLGS